MRKALLVVLAAAVPFVVSACAKEEKTYTVEYKVTGTAQSVDVAYTADEINKETAKSVSLPWSKTITAKTGTAIVMIVQNVSESGDVKGEVIVEGQSVKTCNSTGPNSTAECGAGLLP